MPVTTLAEAVISGDGIDVTVRLLTPDDPSAGLLVFATVLDQAMLVAANQVIVPALKATLSVEGPPVSDPFTPPHRVVPDPDSDAAPSDSPPLIDSVGAWADPEGGVAVGSTNLYGLYLEIGTQDMAPRPWLVPTLTRSDVMNAFNAALARELERLLAGVAGDSAPAQPAPSGAVTN